MKPLFITIDTEGDSLWNNPSIGSIRTENVLCIPRFQELCEKYGFVPIWLTDYEIISDDRYVNYIKNKNRAGLCEVGIHVHARNNPPLTALPEEKDNGAAYLIEYPEDEMKDKFFYLKDLIEKRLECKVITHRAGRWALNQTYIDLLGEAGIKYDCSVTPGIDWSFCEGITPGSKGSDYRNYKREKTLFITKNLVEISEYPVSIFARQRIFFFKNFTLKSVLKSFYYFFKKTKVWLRPNGNINESEMKYALNKIMNSKEEYAEFMIHSSELMSGGSPNFKTEESIEKMYTMLEEVFEYAQSIGYKGFTFATWEKFNSEKLNDK